MEKYSLIFVAAAGILCIPALAEIELPLSSDKPFLIGRPHPTLAEIEELHIDVMDPIAEPNKLTLIWIEIGTKIKHKISEAGIKVTDADEEGYAMESLFIPQLRVNIETIRLDDLKQCVFRVQTSLSRAVRLGKQNEGSFLFKADVWKAEPVMQAASVQDMPTVVSSEVLKQVDSFIRAWHDANPPNKQTLDANDIGVVSQTAPTKYMFAASKNSQVFHRPDCRFARIISPDNLVGYTSRDEAVAAGKRACKTCKP